MRYTSLLALVLIVGLGAPAPLWAQEENHWAFQPLRVVNPPETGRHPIDAFIERKLKEGGISLQEESKVHVHINPEKNHMIKEDEQAIIIP